MKKIINATLATLLVLSISSSAFAYECNKQHCIKPVKHKHVKKHKACYKRPPCYRRAVPVAAPIYKGEMPIPVAVFVPNWYVGGHIGESRTHDNKAANSNDSVTQIGPGWTADIGYQFL